MAKFSARADAIALRTYQRPYDDGTYETWEQVVERVLKHTNNLVPTGFQELEELRQLFISRKCVSAGRTLWLGGTDIAYKYTASQFNCAFTVAQTVDDLVDIFWLLLLGCGVGFQPLVGTLRGFDTHIPEIQILASSQPPDYKGREESIETFEDGVWTISIGDSAAGWARSLGMLLSHDYSGIHKLVLDFTEIRGAGERLAGFGWICNGAQPLIDAYIQIVDILNHRHGQILTEINILDVVNLIGTVLSSRRSAEIALLAFENDRLKEFVRAKADCWGPNSTTRHRQQSNNSVLFSSRPKKSDLGSLFTEIVSNGGSEPGIINRSTARNRATYFVGLNPCAEILLPNKGFCNLVEVDVAKFRNDFSGLLRAVELMGRFNYRQTCVDLRDGVLQKAWHQTNKALRLCGVSLTGIVQSDLTDSELRHLRRAAHYGAMSMADECGTNRPSLVTTVKPSGTVSKVMDTTEGIHKPLGKYIFNWVNFSTQDPIIERLKRAGYRSKLNPVDSNNTLICFPVKWDHIEFTNIDGKEVNTESAITQLERYKRYMTNWCDHNVSITVSYDPSEVDEIINWLIDNWDVYVAVSFMFRVDPTKTAADYGADYLPQEVVLEEDYNSYVKELSTPDFSNLYGIFDPTDEACASGACPIR